MVKKLLGIATDESDWKIKLQQAAPAGFDDVVISAPDTDPIEKGLCFLKKERQAVSVLRYQLRQFYRTAAGSGSDAWSQNTGKQWVYCSG